MPENFDSELGLITPNASSGRDVNDDSDYFATPGGFSTEADRPTQRTASPSPSGGAGLFDYLNLGARTFGSYFGAETAAETARANARSRTQALNKSGKSNNTVLYLIGAVVAVVALVFLVKK